MIKRLLFSELVAHLSKKEISFIIGPRQAGKTTIMMLLKEHVEKQAHKTVFLNLDIESDKQYFTSQEHLLRKIRLEIGETHGFVFIDEIQRKENAGLFLKGIYDMGLPYKFIVSGSGSLELKEDIHESLAGRKRVFILPTVRFDEFFNYRTGYRYENHMADYIGLERDRVDQLLTEYLNFGGYPRVIIEQTENEKRKIIAELYQSYLERDIAYLLGVQKTEQFTLLVRLLAAQIGNLVNVAELSGTLGISASVVNNYIWYMQKTYLLEKVPPYFRNVRKEITKSPVYYFSDLGMCTFSQGRFGLISERSDNGFLFQNFIHFLLQDKTKDSAWRIHYWRTTDKAEVDFVIDTGHSVIPIEAKYKKLTEPEMTRSFQSFLSKYHPDKAYLIHLGSESTMQVKNTLVHCIPYRQFIFASLA